MERMDISPYQVLRSTPQLSNNLYSMGYSRSSYGCTCRRLNIPSVRKEKVPFVKSRFGAQITVYVSTLRRGRHRLLLWPDQEADGCVETKTPSKIPMNDEMGRLEKVYVFSIPSNFSIDDLHLLPVVEKI